MAKLVFNFEGTDGAKLKRAFDSFCMQNGQTGEEVLLPTLRGIAQQMGVDANDTDEDQEATLSRSEGRAARIAQARQNTNQPKARIVE